MADLIIVTGAAGFIGRNLVAALNGAGYTNLLLVDRLRDGSKWKNLLGLQFEDLLGPEMFLERLPGLPRASTLFHLGACSATTESNADYLLENNYRFTRKLCGWCQGRTRFVYASSAATYGDGRHGYSDDDATTMQLRPLNMYGYSKHMFDLWALQRGLFAQKDPLHGIVGLKYFNVYGPYEDHKGDMRSVIHKAFHEIRETGQVRLFRSHRPDFRDGEQERDFVHVKDAVRMTMFFGLTSNRSGLFNCGTGNARTWNHLAAAVFAAMGLPARIEYVDMPQSLRAKYQYHTQAEMEKARLAGVHEDFLSLEDGIRDYVQGYLSPHPAPPRQDQLSTALP